MKTTTNVKKGIGLAVIAIVAVILVAAAGAAVYFLSTQGPSQSTTKSTTAGATSTTGTQQSSTTTKTSTTTTNVPGGTTTTQTSSTSSTISTTATSAQTSSATAAPLVINGAANVLGNFSQMHVQYSSYNSSESNTADVSFFTVGHPVVNGIQTTEVNETLASSGTSGNSTTSFLMYFDHNWNITMVTVSGYNFTGPQAQAFSFAFYGFFTMFGTYSSIWTDYYSDFSVVSTGPQTFGSVTMQVTTYSANSIAYQGVQYGSFSLSVGQIPNTGFSMMTKWSSTVSYSSGSSYTATYELISATRA